MRSSSEALPLASMSIWFAEAALLGGGGVAVALTRLPT
jgi:hypothetical protein